MSLMRCMFPLRRDEGSAVIATMLVLLAILALGTAMLRTAQHSNESTSMDREGAQAFQAAEAGANKALGMLQTSGSCAVSIPEEQLYDRDRLVGSYEVTVTGTDPDCLITSTGHAATGRASGVDRSQRKIIVQVERLPQADFTYTLFAEGSNGTIAVKDNGTINGDIYTENLDQSVSNLNADNVISTASVTTRSNSTYAGTIWSGGNINVGSNGTVGQSVIAAGTQSGTDGDIALGGNVNVAGDALAKGDVTLAAGADVVGTTTSQSASVPTPPTLSKPTLNASAITVTGSSSQITTLLNTNKNSLSGTYRANDGGTVTFPTNGRITGAFVLVNAGKISMGSNLTMVGGPYTVVIASENTANDAISISNQLHGTSSVRALFYSAGGVIIDDNASFTGAVYSNYIEPRSRIAIHRARSLLENLPAGLFTFNVPSATYTVLPVTWREVDPN